jgi:hypothetical protein
MDRRSFLRAGVGAGVLSSGMQGAGTKNTFIELVWFRMRNTTANQVARTQDFLGKHFLPAAQRAGIGPMGFFAGLIAADGPFVLCVLGHPSWESIHAASGKMRADMEYAAAFEQYNSAADIPYVRMESWILRAFDSVPRIEVPPAGSGHIFELRTYESNTAKSLAKKAEMFDRGEVAIFRKTGLTPVFFGVTLVGGNMPNLTYMLAYDDLAAREKNWRAFLADPDWKKLLATPGYSDAEIVSNSSSALLRALPFSPIR